MTVEYNGEAHYHQSNFYGRFDFIDRIKRDYEKQWACNQQQVTLIVIPYFETISIEILAKTILTIRPDLQSIASIKFNNLNLVKSIEQPVAPQSMEQVVERAVSFVQEDKDRQEEKTRVMLLSSWQVLNKNSAVVFDPTGYYCSEKIDGVRAYWDGSSLKTKYGKELFAPQQWVAGLPANVSLDGELWYEGVGRTHSIAKIQKSEAWSNVKFYVFDIIPRSIEAEDLPFHKRLGVLNSLENLPNHVIRMQHEKCNNVQHFYEMVNALKEKHSEGIVLRDPNNIYEFKRSKTLFSYKFDYFSNVQFIKKHEKTHSLICKQYVI